MTSIVTFADGSTAPFVVVGTDPASDIAVVRAQATFWRMWLLRGGFLDGGAGAVLCLASAFSVLSKYTKLWRLGQS